MPTPMHARLTPAALALLMILAVPACQPEAETTLDATEDMAVDTMETMQAPMAGDVQKVNLNTATADEFLAIPDVGDRMVREFMEYRPYASIQQFRREMAKYVEDDQIAAYEEYVFVPVQYNESDAETLQQLPGIDAGEAEQLVAARPFASREAFMTALGGYASADEVADAEMYLATQ